MTIRAIKVLFAVFCSILFCAEVGKIHAAEAKKYKIFLSMSYIGNDRQAEAQNMINAMAKAYPDRVDLQTQVAGPVAQKQIQQLNAMVQAGADAIIVYPISPTALNASIKNACDHGIVVFAYDSRSPSPAPTTWSRTRRNLPRRAPNTSPRQ